MQRNSQNTMISRFLGNRQDVTGMNQSNGVAWLFNRLPELNRLTQLHAHLGNRHGNPDGDCDYRLCADAALVPVTVDPSVVVSGVVSRFGSGRSDSGRFSSGRFSSGRFSSVIESGSTGTSPVRSLIAESKPAFFKPAKKPTTTATTGTTTETIRRITSAAQRWLQAAGQAGFMARQANRPRCGSIAQPQG